MRLNKIKKEKAKYSAVRVKKWIETDYRWWRHQDVEPECGYVEVQEVSYTNLFPPKKIVAAKKQKNRNLSQRKLRKRLSDAGYRGSDLRQLLNEIRNPSFDTERFSHDKLVMGWREGALKMKLGRSLFNRVTYKVPRILVIFDEMHYYMSSELGEFYRSAMSLGRKYNIAPVLITQSHLDFNRN